MKTSTGHVWAKSSILLMYERQRVGNTLDPRSLPFWMCFGYHWMQSLWQVKGGKLEGLWRACTGKKGRSGCMQKVYSIIMCLKLTDTLLRESQSVHMSTADLLTFRSFVCYSNEFSIWALHEWKKIVWTQEWTGWIQNLASFSLKR